MPDCRLALTLLLCTSFSAVAISAAVAGEPYVRAGEVERLPARSVANTLLRSVADRAVAVSWDEPAWHGGSHRAPLLLLQRPEEIPWAQGICSVAVTSLRVFPEGRAVHPSPTKPSDALRVAAINSDLRYLIVGRVAEQREWRGDPECSTAPALRKPFLADGGTSVGEVVEAVLQLQAVLDAAKSKSTALKIECTPGAIISTPCGAQVADAVASFRLDDLKRIRIAGSAPKAISYEAILEDPNEKWWALRFDRAPDGALPPTIHLQVYDWVVLTNR